MKIEAEIVIINQNYKNTSHISWIVQVVKKKLCISKIKEWGTLCS